MSNADRALMVAVAEGIRLVLSMATDPTATSLERMRAANFCHDQITVALHNVEQEHPRKKRKGIYA